MNQKMFFKNSQLFSWDMVISAMIFIIIFLSIAMLWDDRSFSFEQQEEKKELRLYSEYAMEALLSSEGLPKDWHEDDINESKISSLGLKDGRYNHIDYEKAQALLEAEDSYEKIKNLLGLAGYEFMLNITKHEGNETDTKALEHNEECRSTHRINRLATDYKDRIYKIKFEGCIPQ